MSFKIITFIDVCLQVAGIFAICPVSACETDYDDFIPEEEFAIEVVE